MGALIRWWFIFCAILTGIVFLDLTGMVNFAWAADHSKLGFVALGLFAIVSPWVGYLTNTITRKGYRDHVRFLKPCWFASDALMGIGMAGTLVGIMMMFTEYMGQFKPGDTAAIQTIVEQMAHGFTTAVITTLIGVVTSMLLKLQLVSLEVGMDANYGEDE